VSGPLSHVTVLDLSRVMAGPWAGQILADLGADVIKIERPGAGDDTRGWGPPFLKAEDGTPTRESGYYLSCNRGKRSITVSLEKPEGQEVIRRIAGRADIVLENFKVGTLARFGLDYAGLRQVNPKLIYCSITGFGQDGPKANQVAYDFLMQAMGGLMSITGEADGQPGGGPQKVGVPIVDLMSGMYATVAVLAALARRNETGEGAYLDISMLDVQAAVLANQAMNYLLTGNAPRRHGNGHPNIMPQQIFQCADGPIVLAVGNDGQFQRLCRALKRDDLGGDARYVKNAGRVENRAELNGALADEFLKWQRGDLVELLGREDVPCGPINTIPEALADPQIVHRGMVERVPHPAAGTVPLMASPIRFGPSGKLPVRTPPLLGEHTDGILAGLGYSAAEIEHLRAQGAV
jgi:crotonobetainyl-CoA:carnitine CoA-transferase CaiB-like acyl-CoA transferase